MLSKKRFYFKIEARVVSHSSQRDVPLTSTRREHARPWPRCMARAETHHASTRVANFSTGRKKILLKFDCWFVYNLANINCRWRRDVESISFCRRYTREQSRAHGSLKTRGGVVASSGILPPGFPAGLGASIKARRRPKETRQLTSH